EHQDVQDWFEQRPTISELRVSEAGAGLADDQRVNDAALGLQCLEESGPRAWLRVWAQRALAQYDIIALQCLQPAVQDLEHGLRVLLVVRRGPDQLCSHCERFCETAAVVKYSQL